MALAPTQKKTGHLSEESAPEPRSGGEFPKSAATGSTESGADSPPVGGSKSGEFPTETQTSSGVTKEDSPPSAGQQTGPTGRVDKIKEIG